MARPLDHDKRVELLSRVVDYIGTHGLDDLTLRPLAAELGTSSRMLVYYFDSRENLIVQALTSQRPAFAEMFGDVDTADQLESRLLELWKSMSDGHDVVSSRILMQVIGIASIKSGVLADFARDSVRSLTDALASAMARCGMDSTTASLQATTMGAAFRGLLLDRFTTGDSERTDAAAAMLFRAAARPCLPAV
ncbi:TetR family transcriptional regulator [Rhodococcus sp. 05-2256-B2]|uniref:TetR family transcriptional regulator n=1 Tax=unclassified Rhodococcus (in: high G+C Gram-positive bacteria) TaxID=192944 RepID=UPI000B9BD585|nr:MULTISPECIES: TetR family transcriptional regulator [unclassified Rhodococcus (in: high G+C Gram-positive bacteria)]OZD89290.1 TetR family transcriptional regulator [Rhodococcus sp. 05-2256-B4]OZD89539.1 TetR family transcriptional regulator [Rhodococcus sp. 05-2256-B3]OZD92819.1 TetR family transcriptional regulator [Rhodococcus sp. 05-2256-B2]OZD97572.1 TetR family transcriptional regulator [Rhodococcus sp. 05-2256-B1]